MLVSDDVNRAILELVRREGVDAWYTQEPSAILPSGAKCAKCGGTEFRKEMDIIDVWFESGSSHAAVLGHEPDLPWPSDLYTEGADQYRGWFQSSLLCALGTRYKPPFKRVSTSGWTLDPKGQAMSKSLGNVVDPVAVANKLGGEIVRLWVASVDFREDVRNSDELMERIAEIYRKLRNTFRFLLSNLDGFDPAQHAVAFDDLQPIDRYMLLRTADFAADARRWYDDFQFHKIYQAALNLCINDLSKEYLDILKDRLYTASRTSPARRSAQTALWRISEALVRLLAPILTFTSEEVWQHMPKLEGRPESVHLALFPTSDDIFGKRAPSPADEQLRTEWLTLFAVREEVLQALEAARSSGVIGSGLEAQVRISAPEAVLPVLEKYAAELRYLFIVSAVELERAQGGNGAAALKVDVAKAPGQKCERCWNYSTHLGEDPAYPTICERCSAALKEIAAAR